MKGTLKSAALILVLGVVFYLGFTYSKPKETPVDSVDNTQNNEISEMQKKIDKYEEDKQNEKMRKLELEALQKPEIIEKQLNKVGKLIVLQGVKTYEEAIKESSFWGSKKLNLSLTYNYGINIDFSKISVAEFHDKTVVLKVPKEELILEYVELRSDESQVQGTKTWLSKNYTADEAEYAMENAWKQTVDSIKNDKQIFIDSMDSLKEQLTNLIHKLGYENIIVEVE